MSRTEQEISAYMDAEQAGLPELSGLNNTSNAGIFKGIKKLIAIVQVTFEKLIEQKIAKMEEVINSGVPPSFAWLRRKSFEFQYDATTPQVMTLVNDLPTYTVIDPSKRIITVCSIRLGSGFVNVLVAKNSPPVKLTPAELSSFQGYFINAGDGTSQGIGIGIAGANITTFSSDPDLLFMEAEVFYTGAYANTIKNDCLSAIEKYLISLPEDGIVRVVDLVDSLQNVIGFRNITIENLAIRESTIGFGSKVYIVQNFQTLLSGKEAFAGYAIGETTSSNTLSDLLTFTPV